MNTITFENGTSMKILIDEMKWTKSSHKYFDSSLNSIIITLLCIQKYYFKQIDKNIFLKIIEEIADASYLVDVSLFADFIITNSKRYLYNTYETFRSQKYYNLFNGLSSKQVNPKYLDESNALVFTRGREDLQLILEEIRDHKTLGLVMILCNTIEIIYLDASHHISGVDLSFSFPFFQDLNKKEEFYELLRNSSVNHSTVSFPSKNKFITIKFIFFLFLLILCYLIYFYELKIIHYP